MSGNPPGAAADAVASRGETSWQSELRGAVRDSAELARRLGLAKIPTTDEWAAAADFPLLVSPIFLARIKPGDPHDPLLLQIAPHGAEMAASPSGFRDDPLEESAAEVVPGLLKKYARRALLITTSACAVHCRYCFRRHFPYAIAPKSLEGWQPALEAIAADRSLDEVLLSGGDPLTLSDELLGELARRLARIPHLRRLRVHSRVPIVIPRRVDEKLIAWLTGTRLSSWMVVHANHPAEIDGPVAAALRRLIEAGVPVLNQAVLLRGVNDSVDVLDALCRKLGDLGVIPYYLHQLDRVRGAAHFEVPVEIGRAIMSELQARLPGYLVPRYVEEVPGAPGKSPL